MKRKDKGGIVKMGEREGEDREDQVSYGNCEHTLTNC